MFKNSKGFLLTLCIVTSLLAFGFFAYGSKNTKSASNDDEFKTQVRNALNEIGFPAIADSAGIDVAVGNLAYFVSYRAGVLMSDLSQERLGNAERLAGGTGKRISKADLAGILTEIAADKLKNLTDSQRDEAVESLRGFDHPNLPDSFKKGRNHVSIRANGQGRMTVAEMIAQFDSVRGSSADTKLVRSLIRNSITLEIDAVCGILTDADPGFFGNTKGDMTPMQALLVSYSVVTNDLLEGNRADLNAKMQRISEGISASGGFQYPGPEGYKAFGDNGYIFSTPSGLLMDERTTDLLISKIAEKLN